MTQEFINKHIADVCHYLGHPVLERTVDNPSVFELFNSLAWCMDVCDAPRTGIGFLIFDIAEWIEFDYWLSQNAAYIIDYGGKNKLFTNARIFNVHGYEFTVVRTFNQHNL